MNREYDVFEEMPDGAPMWRDHAVGQRAAVLLLNAIAKTTANECFIICLHDKEIVGRANVGTKRMNGKPVVFQIAYDHIVAKARTSVLRQHGCEAFTAIGNDAARILLVGNRSYDLFLVGHSANLETRREMVRWLKANFPRVPVLALNLHDGDIAEADYNVAQASSDVWLAMVTGILKRLFGRNA